jgi:hypothetical protein
MQGEPSSLDIDDATAKKKPPIEVDAGDNSGETVGK